MTIKVFGVDAIRAGPFLYVLLPKELFANFLDFVLVDGGLFAAGVGEMNGECFGDDAFFDEYDTIG